MTARFSKPVPPAQVRPDYRTPLIDRLNRVVESAQMGRSDLSIKNPATGVSYDSRTVLPLNPWKMRVYANNAQTWLATTWTVVNFDTNTGTGAFDSSNGFNTSTHQYTIPVSGIWLFTVQCNVTTNASGMQFFLALWQNGVAMSYNNQIYYGTGAGFLYESVNDALPFQQGDLIDIHVYTSANSGLSATGWGAVFWSMHLLSAY